MNQQVSAKALTVGIDHVGLTVPNLDTTLRFFIDCLGWAQVGARPDYPAAFVSDGHVVLTLWEVTQPTARMEFNRKANVGLHHLALLVSSEAALDAIFAKVTQWPGVVVEFAPEDFGGGSKRHAMIYEPGGIRLEFACNRRAAAD